MHPSQTISFEILDWNFKLNFKLGRLLVCVAIKNEKASITIISYEGH
jgi:hypothetical protein